MIVLAPLAAVGAVMYLATALAVHHWPRHDPMAPQLTRVAVEREVRRRPRLARFLRRRVDPRLVTGLALTAAALGLAAVGLLLVMARDGAGLGHFDLGASTWAAEQASPLGGELLQWITHLGGTETMIVLAVVVLAVEHRRVPTSRAGAGLLIVTLAGQSALANGIKWLVGRARPDLAQLSGFASSSFPSGHAANAAAAFAVFALLLGRGRSRPVRAALAATAAAVAGIVAATRVLLGVHWLTDVAAGLALGWAWFALCSMAFGGRDLRFGEPVAYAEDAVPAAPSTPATPATPATPRRAGRS